MKNLFAKLHTLSKNYENFHIDETVQWAINELSEEAHAHILGALSEVVAEFDKLKQEENVDELAHNIITRLWNDYDLKSRLDMEKAVKEEILKALKV